MSEIQIGSVKDLRTIFRTIELLTDIHCYCEDDCPKCPFNIKKAMDEKYKDDRCGIYEIKQLLVKMDG